MIALLVTVYLILSTLAALVLWALLVAGDERPSKNVDRLDS